MRPWTRPRRASRPSSCCSFFTWPFRSLQRRGIRDSTCSRWKRLCTPSAFQSVTECLKSNCSFVHVCCRQDANECWLQMMRVLQQKLEPLESDTPMEVRIPSLFSNTMSTLNDVLNEVMALFDICRLSLRAVPLLPRPRRTSSTSILALNLKLRILVMCSII